MEYTTLIISFIVLMVIFVIFFAFILHRFFIASADGAVQRLDQEYIDAGKKQSILNKKIRQADEELTQKRNEARVLAEKMRDEAEQETKDHRDKIISSARKEADEILNKGKMAVDKLNKDLNKNIDTKVIQYSMRILNNILAKSSKDAFNDILIKDYILKLKEMDMSNIDKNIKDVDLISVGEIMDETKNNIQEVLKQKLDRDLTITPIVDKSIGGGMVLKFGSMALDGSLSGVIREEAIKCQQEVDNRR